MNPIENNADAVRRGYEAINTGDMPTLAEVFDENASWRTPGRSFVGGGAHGRDAVLDQFARYDGGTGGRLD
jgi:uncharacterized protein